MSKQISLEQVIDTISVMIHDSSNAITVEQDFMEFDGNSVTVKYDRKFNLPIYEIEHEDHGRLPSTAECLASIKKGTIS